MHTEATKERLFGRLAKLDSGCWEYTGCCHAHNGYGTLRVSGKQYKAHRLMWEIECGEIPSAMRVLHRCDNPPCCNPDHLYLGTQQNNMTDMINKGRANHGKGVNHSKATLTEDQVHIIRRLFTERKYTQEQIGDMFNVTKSAVAAIGHKRTWTHLPDKDGENNAET